MCVCFLCIYLSDQDTMRAFEAATSPLVRTNSSRTAPSVRIVMNA